MVVYFPTGTMVKLEAESIAAGQIPVLFPARNRYTVFLSMLETQINLQLL